MSRSAWGGTGRPLAMSANWSQPPGRSTRRISSNTACLSAHRLMTPLAMTASAQPSSTGRLGQPFAELDLGQAEQLRGLAGLGEHLGRHVDADHLSRAGDERGRACGQVVVDPPAPVAAVDQPGFPQHPQMVREQVGGDGHRRPDVSHTAPGIGEHDQDLQPGRVAQCREHRRRSLGFNASQVC
jgi:hypothetical protein